MPQTGGKAIKAGGLGGPHPSGAALEELRNAYVAVVPFGRSHRWRHRLSGGDFGKIGRCWREADMENTDLETVLNDLLAGEYKNPMKVVGFNTAEGWSRDVSEDVANEIRRRCDLQMTEVPPNLQEFVERHEERADRRQLRLV